MQVGPITAIADRRSAQRASGPLDDPDKVRSRAPGLALVGAGVLAVALATRSTIAARSVSRFGVAAAAGGVTAAAGGAAYLALRSHEQQRAATSSRSLLVKLEARPDFSEIERMPRGPERKAAAWNALVDTAERSQRPVIEVAERLQAEGAIVGYETLVSPNMVIVTPRSGQAQAVQDALRGAEGVKAIYTNSNGSRVREGDDVEAMASAARESRGRAGGGIEQFRGLDVIEGSGEAADPPTELPWGIERIGAPAAWEDGATGAGLVYGSIDTGADVEHEAIAGRYRGRARDGAGPDHDYNWFDARGGTAPRDRHGHGTHTIGTAVGEGIGVAPEAEFIAASALSGRPDSTLKAIQWMLAPTRVDGSDPDPTRAPDVVGMSWWMGPNDDDLFQESMQDLRAAGIVPVKSAGNRGPNPRTITSPGQFPEIFATGSVDDNDTIARSSSRGPAPFPPGDTTPKPNFSAPGVQVLSSTPGGRYTRMSGTSMAQPHMSGAVLVLLARHPSLTDAELEQALVASARDRGAPGFDADYGHGIIDLEAALVAAEEIIASREAVGGFGVSEADRALVGAAAG